MENNIIKTYLGGSFKEKTLHDIFQWNEDFPWEGKCLQ